MIVVEENQKYLEYQNCSDLSGRRSEIYCGSEPSMTNESMFDCSQQMSLYAGIEIRKSEAAKNWEGKNQKDRIPGSW